MRFGRIRGQGGGAPPPRTAFESTRLRRKQALKLQNHTPCPLLHPPAPVCPVLPRQIGPFEVPECPQMARAQFCLWEPKPGPGSFTVISQPTRVSPSETCADAPFLHSGESVWFLSSPLPPKPPHLCPGLKVLAGEGKPSAVGSGHKLPAVSKCRHLSRTIG